LKHLRDLVLTFKPLPSLLCLDDGLALPSGLSLLLTKVQLSGGRIVLVFMSYLLLLLDLRPIF
jgi:hypothetical protein